MAVKAIRAFFAILMFWAVAQSASAQQDQGAAAPAPPPSSRWPMYTQTTDGAAVTIFQPQMEDFQENQLTARAAVAVTVANQQEPIFGAIWLSSRIAIDRVSRTVQVLDVNVTRTKFGGADPVAEPALAAAVKQAILSHPITLSLDQLLAMLEVVHKEQSAAADLENNPPAIIFRQHPTIKIQYDGPPRLIAASDSGLMRAVNTPFFVALDPQSKRYYLKGAGHWFVASDPLGPFQSATAAPPLISALADESGYSDPQEPISDTQAATVEIVTATTPTELIWTDGPPQLATITGTSLLYWTNTESDVLLSIDSQQLFVLLSGRWFTGPNITGANQNGPWTFVPPDKLPPDFAKIPPGGPKGDVLAFVAGTAAAADADADNQLPQTAAVDTSNFDQPPVQYDGDPDFQDIQGTGCSYALNTDAAVFGCDNNYYCCYAGVWYICEHPTGPWRICDRVPKNIYTIPPSCPLYPCRFCYVYGRHDKTVYCGYLPGYVGSYGFGGVVVYGTGYSYAPWIKNWYVPRPATFGFAPHYDAYAGHWGFHFATALGGGDAWISQKPRFAGAGGAWFGFGGYRPNMIRQDVHINPNLIRANNVRAANQADLFGRNVYERRHDVRNEPAAAVLPRVINGPPREDLQNNDVFTDREGNIFRHTPQGWLQRDNGQWTPQPQRTEEPQRAVEPEHAAEQPPQEPVERPQPQPQRNEADRNAELEREYQARQEGEQRARNNPPPQAPEPSHPQQSGGNEGGGGGGGARHR